MEVKSDKFLRSETVTVAAPQSSNTVGGLLDDLLIDTPELTSAPITTRSMQPAFYVIEIRMVVQEIIPNDRRQQRRSIAT